MDFNIEYVSEFSKNLTNTCALAMSNRSDGWWKSLRLISAATIFLAVALALSSCGNGSDVEEVGDAMLLETVRGLVLEVESESLISIAALEVQDSDGRLWRFEGRGKVVPGFTPSHLNEHKLLGQEVGVTFYREGEALVLHNITD